MSRMRRLLTTTTYALPVVLAATAAHAAGLLEAAKNTGQFSTLVAALERSGMAQQLEGKGPFTIFAPTDAAFESLPRGVVDSLMKDANKDQLTRLLQHHVVQGQKLTIEDALGKQTQVDALSQDRLTVDGTNQMTLVVPTGLQITRVGDELFAERTAAVTTLPAVTVETATPRQGQGQGGQPAGEPTPGAEPAAQGSPGQQLKTAQRANQPSPLEGGQAASGQPQSQPVQGAQQAGQGAPQQQAQAAQSAPQQGGQAAPQQQAQSGQARQGAQQRSPLDQQEGIFRAAVITQPQVEADNGVIHGINEVLIPQGLEQALTQMHVQGASQQQGAAQPPQGSSKPDQG